MSFESENNSTRESDSYPRQRATRSTSSEHSGQRNESITRSLVRLSSETPSTAELSNASRSRLQLQFEELFSEAIARNDIELGFTSDAERLVGNVFQKVGPFVREWINSYFLKVFRDADRAAAVLRIISHLKYEHISPQGTTMAVAALLHQDPVVKEAAVRCFENWGDPGAADVLGSLTIQETWLKDYVDDVIADLTIGQQRALFGSKD